MPTLLELAKTAPPKGHRLDGRSLLPLLFASRDDSDATKAGVENRQLCWQIGGATAIRQGPWKLLRTGKGKTRKGRKAKQAKKATTATNARAQLFHLGRDIGETRDLSAEEPERVRRMLAARDAWYADVTTGATAQPEQPGEKGQPGGR